MKTNKRCTKLSEINIYTIEHSDEPISFRELYFDEHMRLVVIPTTQNITVIYVDLYPTPCKELADIRCTKISTPGIELCKLDVEIEHKPSIDIIRSEILLTCIERDSERQCEAINLKIFSSASVAQVMEMCLEDLWRVIDEVRRKCGSH